MDVALSDYHGALEYLFARTTGAFKFGLDRTRALLGEMDDPHLEIPTLHIAGTNGKGSCVATAEAILGAKGLRVARYTSPHLVDFRERIVVGGTPISPDEVVGFVDRWTPTIERIGATFFEATTAMAFLYFARERAEVSLVETGLGGRLDATNVVEPRAAGVVSIGYDHQDYLGSTLESIAAEKAGIFKRGAPAVIGEPAEEVAGWLAAAARAAGASVVRVVRDETRIDDVSVDERGTAFTLHALGERARVRTPLAGPHQAANFAFTLCLLDASSSVAAAGRAAGASVVRVVRDETRIDDVSVDERGTAFTLHALGERARVRTPLAGPHQAANFAFTLCLLDAAGAPFAATLDEASAAASAIRLPGRMHQVGRWIFDVAHNADGARTLATTLAAIVGEAPVTVVLCVLADKDWRAMLEALRPIAKRFILTDAPTAPASRRWRLEEATDAAARLGVEVRAVPDFDAALAEASSYAERTLVTGSFHTVGDAMARLQVSPLSG